MLLLIALLAQTATSENIVSVTSARPAPGGSARFSLELISDEPVGFATDKVEMAGDVACKATGVDQRTSMIVEIVARDPSRHRIRQTVRCKPTGA